jgi:hypothetical protein
MRNLQPDELDQVQGGLRLFYAGASVLAWAYANRASLLTIAESAWNEHQRLKLEDLRKKE